MASERQIAANKKNAARSSGPKTEQGKARSRLNATKHGLAGQSAEVEAQLSPEFLKRRQEWGADRKVDDRAAEWALDRAVAASLRIERCEREVDKLCAVERDRAILAWDEDRALEAANIAARLPKDPVVASRQLQTSLAGVILLIQAWLGLVEVLDQEDWSESEASKALDLLGVDPELRSARTRIDAPEGTDLVEFRRNLALDEVERLEELHDRAMVPLDELDQRHAMAGDAALLSKRAALVLRYERDAWKRYNQAIKELNSPAEAVPAPPTPVVARPAPARPAPARVTASPSTSPSFEEERRALLAEAAPYRDAVVDQFLAEGVVDEDAWLDALEQRLDALTDGPTERTQFGRVATEPAS